MEIQVKIDIQQTIPWFLLTDEVGVIDEIQMLRDPQRGWAWTRALLGVVAEEVHLCGEAAAIELVKSILITTGEELEVRIANASSNVL